MNSEQWVRRKKMSMTEKVKDLVVRRKSRETSQEKEDRRERKISES